MAEFLTRNENTSNIERIIKKAKNHITLMTPFLQLDENFIERIKDAARKKKKITLIYGKNELKVQEKNFLFELPTIEIYYYENLHAKCYHNEQSLVISSMNLYKYSMQTNREMGVLLDKDKDKEAFEDALDEIESIKNASELIKSIKSEENSFNSPTILMKDIIELRSEYKEGFNFYLPSLHNYFQKVFPDFESTCTTEELIVKGFPIVDKHLYLDHRITVFFDTDQATNDFKKKYKKNFLDGVKYNELYYNERRFNLYFRDKHQQKRDKENTREAVIEFITNLNMIIRNTKMAKIILPIPE